MQNGDTYFILNEVCLLIRLNTKRACEAISKLELQMDYQIGFSTSGITGQFRFGLAG